MSVLNTTERIHSAFLNYSVFCVWEKKWENSSPVGQEKSCRGCLNALKKKDESCREGLTLFSPPVRGQRCQYVETGHTCKLKWTWWNKSNLWTRLLCNEMMQAYRVYTQVCVCVCMCISLYRYK